MIPLLVPHLGGNEWKYVKDCLDSNWVSSVGSYVDLFEKRVAEFCEVPYAIATSNGTAALHISLLLSGVKKGDLVILPNITFVAPANVVKYIGADPILIDVVQDTWQMDLELLEKFLEENSIASEKGCFHKKSGRKISCVLPVHILGNIGDMDKLMLLADEYNFAIVEDATEALGSFYNDKHAGSFGKFGCLSFNGNKIITTGGGGMILTSNETLARKAKHLTTQAKANPDEYYHDEVGYNYRMVNVLAALGVAQMEQLPSFLKRKKEIASRYRQFFQNIAEVSQQKSTGKVTPNNWLYTIKANRQKDLRESLLSHHIHVRPLWVPMNQLPAFKNDIFLTTNNISEKLYKKCLSLPCSAGLSEAEQERVIEVINSFYND